METIALLDNPILDYGWGSATAIPDLLGTSNDDGIPQAEMWMGAHPKAPSMVISGSQRMSLEALIRQHPKAMLGEKTISKFGHQLPYLFKVLAAEKPLSIQAHPNKVQAEIGFRREENQGISLDAPTRNYRDPNHKPECICALTPFWALNGFRPFSDTMSRLQRIFGGSPDFRSDIENLINPASDGAIKQFFQWLMTLRKDRQTAFIKILRSFAESRVEADPIYDWITRLCHAYPSDIGVSAPLFLNLICLEAGQAMFLPAGELHSYLEGVGIELMANSDNVLRGGLTPKHVDVAELLRILNFTERKIDFLSSKKINICERIFDSMADEFVLSVISVRDGVSYHSSRERRMEILLCTSGSAQLGDSGSSKTVDIRKGASLVVPAAAPPYAIHGHATLYKAAVPV